MLYNFDHQQIQLLGKITISLDEPPRKLHQNLERFLLENNDKNNLLRNHLREGMKN